MNSYTYTLHLDRIIKLLQVPTSKQYTEPVEFFDYVNVVCSNWLLIFKTNLLNNVCNILQ